MITHLTQQVADKAQARTARVDYRDARPKGLVLRAMPSGVKSWYPIAKIKKSRVDDCLKVRYLSEGEATKY